MPDAQRDWRLYTRTVELNPRLEKTVYFFSKEDPAQGRPAEPPVGYRVAISEKTGVPFLMKIATDAGIPHDRREFTKR